MPLLKHFSQQLFHKPACYVVVYKRWHQFCCGQSIGFPARENTCSNGIAWIHPHWGGSFILALQAQASFRKTPNAMKGLLAYLPLTLTYVPSHGLGSPAQAHRHKNLKLSCMTGMQIWLTVVKQSEIVYSLSITSEQSGFQNILSRTFFYSPSLIMDQKAIHMVEYNTPLCSFCRKAIFIYHIHILCITYVLSLSFILISVSRFLSAAI